jgi:CCR4-NOT transcription complex subunit 10
VSVCVQNQVKSSKKEIKGALEIFTRELRPTSSSSGGDGAKNADSDDDTDLAVVPPTPTSLSGSGTPNLVPSGGDPSLPPPACQNVAALYLKANLEYLRHNYRKALKLLASAHRADGGAASPTRGMLYLNNMGCLHFRMGLYHLGLQYFQKALLCYEPPGPGGKPLEADGRVLPQSLCESVYNAGVQLLLAARYPEAFRCFENASVLYYNRPRLWLRMAECCVQHYLQGQQERSRETRNLLVRAIVGKGRFRRVMLPVSNDPSDKKNPALMGSGGDDAGPGAFRDEGAAEAKEQSQAFQQGGSMGMGSGRFGNGGSAGPGAGQGQGAGAGQKRAAAPGLRGQCNLQYAAKCLRNVLFLLANTSQGGDRSRLHVGSLLGAKAASQDGHGAGGGGAGAGAGANADGEAEGGADNGAQEKEQDEALLQQVALLNLSFVYLCLEEPVLALHYAETLLGLPGVSDAKLCTAHTYAAEALCKLSRPAEALRHLMPNREPLPEEAAAAAVSLQKQRKTREIIPPNLPESHFTARARSALHLNLANVYLMQNNLPVAEQCVRAGLKACPNSPEALRALIYVLLRKGRASEALEVLKYRRPVRDA